MILQLMLNMCIKIIIVIYIFIKIIMYNHKQIEILKTYQMTTLNGINIELRKLEKTVSAYNEMIEEMKKKRLDSA